ncbi:MAG TPA: c-type cytochrome [Bryobacteraceae bacterium]|nr:c-type cytochrome [Bryobacteraceae bacterium]
MTWAALASWAVILHAQVQLISRPVPPADAVERGQKLFVANCGFCHGATARGGEGGPDLVRSVVVLDDDDAEHIGPVIRQGRPGTAMPSFDLPEAQIRDIAAFLRSRTQAAIDRRAYQLKELNTGDAKAGEAYFNGAGKCNSCHSPAGDLAGVAKRYETQALLEKFLYPARGRERKPVEAAVKLASGQTVSGQVEYLDDFILSVRDAEGEYHSWPRDSVQAALKDPYAAHQDLLRQYTDADIHNLLAYLANLR